VTAVGCPGTARLGLVFRTFGPRVLGHSGLIASAGSQGRSLTGHAATVVDMKAAQIAEFSEDLSAVSLHEVPRPAARPGFVVVKVVAAAANVIDCKVMAGYLEGTWNTPLPLVIGYDFSGTVSEVGDGVDGFAAGDDVFAVNWGMHNHGAGTEDEPVGGAFAEYISIAATKLSDKPTDVSHEQAAAVALVGTTAKQGLDVIGSGAGKSLVIVGGSSAVGIVAIQLAKLQGATVVTTCSPRTLGFVSTLGADRIIDYTTDLWFEDAELLSDKVDAVFDTVGQNGTFADSRAVLNQTGSFVSIANFEVGVDPNAHAPLSFASYYCLANDPEVQDELAALLEQGKLNLPVEDEFPFTKDGIVELLQKQRAGKSIGKNVLKVS
jgi:NADPH2:quinone reductase